MSTQSSDQAYQKLWEKQLDSGNRSNSPKYLKEKAIEQANLIQQKHKKNKFIDLGCGAGELLQYLMNHLDVETGLDFSNTILDEAKKTINQSPPELICADSFEYLPSCKTPNWMTTGALNQYLDKDRLKDLLVIFSQNTHAESFYLFDCIDPIRRETTTLGSSYLNNNIQTSKLKKIIVFVMNLMKLLKVIFITNFISSSYRYKNKHMGFAHLPSTWHSLAKKTNLKIEIVSSRFFEYRYHVIITKNDTDR